jgi:hypothetical protein
MKQFMFGLVAGILVGSGATYMIADYYWPTIKVRVQSGPNPFYGR